MKKVYARPALLVQGKLEAVTHGGSKGNALDATFPVGTPFSQLTSS